MIAGKYWHADDGERLHPKLVLLNEYIFELNSSHDVNTILRNSTRKIAAIMEVDSCHLLLSRKVRRQLRLETAYFFSKQGYQFPKDADETKGISGLAFETAHPVVVNDAANDPRATPKIVEAFQVAAVLAVPIIVKDRVLGVATVHSETKNNFGQVDVDFLSALAVQLGLAVENARLMDQLKLAASTDALTGLFNYGYFRAALDREMANTGTKDDQIVSLLMIDINNFKKFNDTYGHVAGDFILKEVAAVISVAVRDGDQVARYGGDEFAVILPGANGDTASSVAERLAKAVSEHRYNYQGQEFTGMISICYGLATYLGVNCGSSGFIECADRGLYQMKKSHKQRKAR
ncbi:sensor domain-containing diguanylate cyclase [Metallumcola ferriviriculae]|uniref:Sensor domain-containing diguanylate cyclase n=1 Tax=Metallumcola ferriviriculae TaxID=3039180 RepID=A0AAU0URB8_9FIRM|nr:sensor domain-containing diguanylate cyclase [Desulfitibacteraceae bacterium MK1]